MLRSSQQDTKEAVELRTYSKKKLELGFPEEQKIGAFWLKRETDEDV